MAHREKGHVTIEIGGRAYRLAMTLDAMVALEDMFSTPERLVTCDEVLALAERKSAKHTRAVIWAALQCNEHAPTLEEISDLVEEAGGVRAFGETLNKLAGSLAPDAKDLEALGIKANPPEAQAGKRRKAGTGGVFTSMPGASA